MANIKLNPSDYTKESYFYIRLDKNGKVLNIGSFGNHKIDNKWLKSHIEKLWQMEDTHTLLVYEGREIFEGVKNHNLESHSEELVHV